MFLQWYEILALIFALPGAFVVGIGLIWAVSISWSVFTAGEGMVDGLSAIGGVAGVFIILVLAVVFGLSITFFGFFGVVYALALFGLFSIRLGKLFFI